MKPNWRSLHVKFCGGSFRHKARHVVYVSVTRNFVFSSQKCYVLGVIVLRQTRCTGDFMIGNKEVTHFEKNSRNLFELIFGVDKCIADLKNQFFAKVKNPKLSEESKSNDSKVEDIKNEMLKRINNILGYYLQEDQSKARTYVKLMIDEITNRRIHSDKNIPEAMRLSIVKEVKEIMEISQLEVGSEPLSMEVHESPGESAKKHSGKLYSSILIYTNLMQLFEKKNTEGEDQTLYSAENAALNLSILFDQGKSSADIFNFLSYVRHGLKNHAMTMSELSSFEFSEIDKINLPFWRKIMLKNIENPMIIQAIPVLGPIENALKNVEEPGKKIKNIRDVEGVAGENGLIGQIKRNTKKYDDLNRHANALTEEEKQNRDKLAKEITKLKIELVDKVKGIELTEKNVDILLFDACYTYILSGETFRYMNELGLTLENYKHFLSLKRVDDDKQIPNIKIDGAEYGYPGKYLMKIPVLDEAHAARAACLGKLTDCCQSLSGEAGQPCVIHGLTSERGGFYVFCEGDVNNPKVSDKLLAQCWAWRGKGEEIVFDSIEASPEIEDDNEIKFFYLTLAEKLVREKHTLQVNVGIGSGVYKENFEENFYLDEKLVFPVNYEGYRDSASQGVLCDANSPEFKYLSLNKENALLLFQEAFKKADDFFNEEFFQLLNWAVVYGQEDILEAAKIFAVEKERTRDLIEVLNSFYKLVNQEAYDLHEMEEIILNKKILPMNIFLNKNKLTPFVAAIRYGNLEVVGALITGGADVNARYSYGRTALMEAADYGHLEVVRALIIHGADVNVGDAHDYTALIRAAYCGHTEVVGALITEGGADVNARHSTGRTALMEAAECGHLEVVRALITQGADVDAGDANGNTALMLAADSGHLEVVGALIAEGGADVNARHATGRTALMEAADSGHLEVVRALITQGADVNAKDANGCTALMEAADSGHLEVVRALIIHGADVKVGDVNDYTALMRAAYRGHTEVVRALIVGGADVNVGDVNDYTALMRAVNCGHTEVVVALIAGRADVNVRDDIGRTPLMWAADIGGHLEVLGALVAGGADVNAGDDFGNTALMLAAYRGLTEEVRALIAWGADVNAKDDFGNTALMGAAERGHSEVASLLIAKGANINIESKDGRTALTRATPELREAMLKQIATQNELGSRRKLMFSDSGMEEADRDTSLDPSHKPPTPKP